MKIDWQAFRRARVARDVRFDGKFFVGAHSTRIYCRPSCPVPTIPDKNVRYFPTAAAAAEAGFRPCLRCRPECSPGTPAWLGTSRTVSRALRLIAESGLEDGGVEGLAERLGVGSRHLRRLFVKHLGATPSAVAQTRRLHFAKKLIDETALPMNQVAIASGFGCVRRFNATIHKTYHRTPTHIRRLARQTVVQPENQYLFRLRFRSPYDWKGMLAFLAPRATPGVETVENGVYRRSISLHGIDGYFEVSLAGRLVSNFGRRFSAASGLTHLFPLPEVLGDAKLTSIGLPTARAETIRTLARAVSDGQISFEGIVDSEAFLARLCEIPGIGKWTAQYVAMRALGEPDAFPSGDLGLLRALKLRSSRELEQRAEGWRPWRAYAAMYLWSIASKSKARETGPLSSRTPKTSLGRTASQQGVSMAV